MARVLLWMLGVILVVVVGAKLNAEISPPGPPRPVQPNVQTVNLPPDPMSRFSLAKLEWRKGGFGSVAIADLTFRNDNDFAVHDAVIECRFYGASGTVINRRVASVYESFPAKGTKKVREISIGFIDAQAKSSSCDAIGVSR